MPSAGGSAADIEAPVADPGASGKGVSTSAIAEAFLKERAELAGPFVGGGVGIAVVQNADGSGHFTFLVTIELFEERDEGGGVFYGDVGTGGYVLEYYFVRDGAGFGS